MLLHNTQQSFGCTQKTKKKKKWRRNIRENKSHDESNGTRVRGRKKYTQLKTEVNCSHSKCKVHLHSRHVIIYYYIFFFFFFAFYGSWTTKECNVEHYLGAWVLHRWCVLELKKKKKKWCWPDQNTRMFEWIFIFFVDIISGLFLANHSPYNFMLNVLTQPNGEQNDLMDFPLRDPKITRRR